MTSFDHVTDDHFSHGTKLITVETTREGLVKPTENDIEDALLAHSPKLRKKIEEGLKDIRAGRSISLSVYKAKWTKRKTRTA
jgi:hypothetical protein